MGSVFVSSVTILSFKHTLCTRDGGVSRVILEAAKTGVTGCCVVTTNLPLKGKCTLRSCLYTHTHTQMLIYFY